MTQLINCAVRWFAASLLVFAWTAPGHATPPSTPLSVDLTVSAAPRLNERVIATVTVESTKNAPGTRVELVLPDGGEASKRQWTVDLKANTPVTLSSSVSIRNAGNVSLSARALRRESRSEMWSDMASVPLTVGDASRASRRGWTVDNVPTGIQAKAGTARIMSTAPTPYIMKVNPAEAPSVLPVLRFKPGQTQGVESVDRSSQRRLGTITGNWSYQNRAGVGVPVNQLLVEVRRGDNGGALSPRAFCFTGTNGNYSCPFTHPGTTVRTWVRTWTNYDNGTGGNRLGVFDGPDGGGCGSDSIDCSYPIQTPAISCPDGTTCNVGSWQVGAGEPHGSAMWMASDLANSWIKALFDNKHGSQFAAGPGRIDYPAPAGHGTHAHVPPRDGWISIEPPSQQSASIVTHEYGHVVMANLYSGKTPSWPTSDCPSPHFIGGAGGPGCALSEGFADFWAWYSTNDPVFRFPGGGTNNMETRDSDTFASGDTVEGNVAAVMGDIFDFANDGPSNGLRDRLSDGIQHVWHTLVDQSDNNFAEYWNAYISFAHSICPALEILRFNTINYTHPSCPLFTVTVSSTSGGFATGSGTFINGTTHTVNAFANGGFNFVRWTEGGSQVSTSPSYTFTVFSNRSLVANFTPLPPAVVTNLVKPTGRITDRRPTFRWGPSARATSYFLQVKEDGGAIVFSRLSTASTLGCADGVTNCKIRLPNAERLDLGRYRWRVRAENAAGQAAYSAYENFRVANPASLAAAD